MRFFSIIVVLIVALGSSSLQAAEADPKDGHHEDLSHLCDGAHADHHGEFDPGKTAFHHISDANVYSIGPWNIPLPCIVYAPSQGWDVFLSNKFHYDFMGHGDGHKSYKGYVLVGGSIHRISDGDFPQEAVDVHVVKDSEDHPYICQGGHLYHVDAKSTADGGIFGGGITSWYDFSLTKNVVTMLIVFGLLAWMFFTIARRYRERRGMAP
ncbi:MAG: hypothetical protein KTR24_08700, partial [Saprospiraceae bacterium]|nr:hypothetical protein [Saprospiraceae bacterium]